MKSSPYFRIALVLVRFVLTLAFILVGAYAARRCWQHYKTEPWTRDGRVNAEIVHIVPEVSGKVIQLPISDNQLVSKGDVLFVIDPTDHLLALQQAGAALATRESELALMNEQSERRQKLADSHAISSEEIRNALNAVTVAQSAVAVAKATRDLAKLDIERSTVISPVNGYVTNLHLRPGDYASAGQEQFVIIDRDSFWVAGYFEETKLPSVHTGDLARIDLMGGSKPLYGRVESISHGISDATTAGKGLADVDPVFNWVRLAQRIPVRIRLDEYPADIFLSSGMTCNVQLLGQSDVKNSAFQNEVVDTRSKTDGGS